MGIFQRLFDLLEEECHCLDREVTGPCDTANIPSFNQYLTTKASLQTLEDELSGLTTELQQAHQVLILLLLTSANPQNSTGVQDVRKLISENEKRISTIVSYNYNYYHKFMNLHHRNLKSSSVMQ